MTAVRRAQAAKAAPSESPQPTRDLVLVVDDDEQMLKLIKRVLERAGFECVAVGDGNAAHNAAVDWRPDIIVLDLMLGATTGEAILAELRKDFRTRLIPVIFLTVRSSLKDKVEHLLNGADDYVTKPFIPEELVARLRAVITRATERSTHDGSAASMASASAADCSSMETELRERAPAVAGPRPEQRAGAEEERSGPAEEQRAGAEEERSAPRPSARPAGAAAGSGPGARAGRGLRSAADHRGSRRPAR